MPQTLRPMLATLAAEVFSDPAWIFEVKWDGVRALCFFRDGEVTLLSRNLNDVTAQYPEVRDAIPAALAGHDQAIIDGEIVAFDGVRPSFQRLQRRMHVADPARVRRAMEDVPVVYCVFDVLYLDGYLLLDCELADRKRLLRDAVKPARSIQVPAEFDAKGEELFRIAVARDLEGIVGKLKTSTYQPGRRTQTWLKFKAGHTLDAVVGGYTEPRGGRQHFGALLLGLYSGGSLVYIGHSGTGFDEALLEQVHAAMRPLETDRPPFAVPPRPNSLARWLRPELVAEIRYGEFTDDGRLRHPVFLGLRDDKTPDECTLEGELPGRPVPAGAPAPEEISVEAEEPAPAVRRPAAIRLTRRQKPLWPAHGGHPPITKEMLAEFYVSMQGVILPLTRDRPMMLNRYPDGIAGQAFYQKDYTDPLPAGVDAYVYHSKQAGKEVHHLVCNTEAALVWLAQLACVELNCWTSRVDHPNKPDFLVLDIDPYVTWQRGRKTSPYSMEDFGAAVDVARKLKPLLERIGLRAFLKTSGQTGLHLCIPLRRDYVFGQVNSFGRTIARHMEQSYPDLITTAWNEQNRAGKVFLDYSINARGKTLCVAYSPRPTPLATVSTPIAWDELGSVRPTDFTFFSIKNRLARVGDLWEGMPAQALRSGHSTC